MTDPLFLGGVLAGLIGAACIAGVYGLIQHVRSRPRLPADWEENYHQPPVTTRVLIRARNVEL